MIWREFWGLAWGFVRVFRILLGAVLLVFTAFDEFAADLEIWLLGGVK